MENKIKEEIRISEKEDDYLENQESPLEESVFFISSLLSEGIEELPRPFARKFVKDIRKCAEDRKRHYLAVAGLGSKCYVRNGLRGIVPKLSDGVIYDTVWLAEQVHGTPYGVYQAMEKIGLELGFMPLMAGSWLFGDSRTSFWIKLEDKKGVKIPKRILREMPLESLASLIAGGDLDGSSLPLGLSDKQAHKLLWGNMIHDLGSVGQTLGPRYSSWNGEKTTKIRKAYLQQIIDNSNLAVGKLISGEVAFAYHPEIFREYLMKTEHYKQLKQGSILPASRNS